MRFFALTSCAVFMIINSGCSVVQVPRKHPVSAEVLPKVAAMPVVIAENKMGVGSSWTYVSTAGATAQYGFIGGMVGGIIDAIVNAGPASRAEKAASEINQVLPTASLNGTLMTQFKDIQKSESPGMPEPLMLKNIKEKQTENIKIDFNYALSEDASVLRVVALATVESKVISYKSPYSGEKATKGPIYTNTFTYYSDPFPVPTLSDELKKQMVEQITGRYTGADGKLPEPKSDDFKKYTKELEQANDNELSKSEASMFLIRKWTEKNGQAATNAVNEAHKVLARQILLDLRRVDVPEWSGQDRTLETLSNGRTIKIVGGALEAGSIISVSSSGAIATWGNTQSYAKGNVDQFHKENAQQRKEKKKKKKS